MNTIVADNLELLDALQSDSESASLLWQPTAYWRNYIGRIRREIEKDGLAEFRSNHQICKGYARGGVPTPVPPVKAWKRMIWNTAAAAPIFNRIINEYQRLVAAEHRNLRKSEIRYSRIVLDEIANQFPDLRIPNGLGNGAPDDAFDWRGHTVTVSFVEHLCRIADFYSMVPKERVRSIVEIGPGVGQSTLSHIAINSNLEKIVNIDIVPVLYVSTQFMKSTKEFEVIDYLDTRDKSEIMISSGDSNPRLYQLTPWQVPQLKGSFEYFFNAYSFQEMENENCKNYVEQLIPMITNGALLHSSIVGHKPNAGGQSEPVTMEFLASLFSTKFRNRSSVKGFASQYFSTDPATSQLFE